MSSVQLTKWMALYEIEPFGDHRADLRMGINTSVIANANRNQELKPDPFTPADFMPFIKRPKKNIDQKIKSVLAKFRK